MKKLFTILAALAVFCCILAGCGQGAALEQGSKVYDGNAVFELGEANTENFSVSIPKKGTGSVERIVIGSKNYTEDFSYSGGVLTIANSLMQTVSSGERQLRVYFEKENDADRDVLDDSCKILFVDKVIRTAQEFQQIGEDLNGSYILANDIDCSSIQSFKPFGRNSGDALDQNNRFFHGVFEGNGYTVSNINIDYRDLEDDPYYNQGQVLGIFTNIGTAGIVRNTTFKNIRVDSRTIAGAICGNNEGRIQNCAVLDSYVTQDCGFGVTCNAAVAVGINAGGGIIENCYAADSAAINRGGWVLVKAEDGVTDMYMTFTANTIYQLAFCGKTWGLIQNCFALDHGVVQPEYMEEKIVSSIEGTEEPFEITERLPLASDLEFFGFSRLDDDPNEGGDAFTGRMVNCQMLSFAEMKTAQNYIDAKFDTAVWNIADGAYPTLKRVFEI